MGQTLVVSLCSNPTTGHRWKPDAVISEPSVLRQTDGTFTGPAAAWPGQPVKAGAPGLHRWTFLPLEPGDTRLHFEYRQPWMQEEAPASIVDVEVAVGEAD